MAVPRSYLFVPGQRPDRFAKAASAGADAIILDLEDAVGPDLKAEARAHVADWFAGGGRGIIRINGVDSPWHEDDLAAVSAIPDAAIMLPKAEPLATSRLAARLPSRPILALIETVAGLASIRETACLPGVARLAFGNLDFAADARIPDSGITLDPARFEIVLASRLGNLPPPVDGVTTALNDAQVIAADVTRARLMGFGAKLCIHPAQVAPVSQGFAPSPEDIDWAHRIVDALTKAAGSVVQVDGKMVDRPLIDRANQILEQAGGQSA